MADDDISDEEEAAQIEAIRNVLGSLKKKKVVSANAVPLADFYEPPGRVEWLRTHGLDVPSQPPAGRNPTPQDVRAVLREAFLYVHYNMPLGGQWTASVRVLKNRDKGETQDRLMEVYAIDYSSETKPVSLGLAGDSDLVRQFLGKLAALCGPFVWMVDDEHPELIRAGS